MPKKKTAEEASEYQRGFKHGHEAGAEMLGKYGRSFAAHQLDQFAANAWRRGISVVERAFDKGYTAGYKSGAKL